MAHASPQQQGEHERNDPISHQLPRYAPQGGCVTRSSEHCFSRIDVTFAHVECHALGGASVH